MLRLHHSIRAGQLKAAAKILAAEPLDIDSPDETGSSPLLLAIEVGAGEIVEQLLAR